MQFSSTCRDIRCQLSTHLQICGLHTQCIIAVERAYSLENVFDVTIIINTFADISMFLGALVSSLELDFCNEMISKMYMLKLHTTVFSPQHGGCAWRNRVDWISSAVLLLHSHQPCTASLCSASVELLWPAQNQHHWKKSL